MSAVTTTGWTVCICTDAKHAYPDAEDNVRTDRAQAERQQFYYAPAEGVHLVLVTEVRVKVQFGVEVIDVDVDVESVRACGHRDEDACEACVPAEGQRIPGRVAS